MEEKNQNEPQDHWDDEDFVNEMQWRVDDYESGKEKGIPWEEVKVKMRCRSDDQSQDN
ncbi:addiction module protein [Mucilaginibacter sp. SJ]|uniref:addiction module protein n=1 Tax=Mucilaginibacter sp. SJ TaxID=3029053 RepID=UPI0023A98A44|nr:addiction module protein [Mucilaginibacter sp. SJ]WEA03445.1 addiction module protein [Mucilaginibacter sp. SJ]